MMSDPNTVPIPAPVKKLTNTQEKKKQRNNSISKFCNNISFLKNSFISGGEDFLQSF